MTNMYLIKNWKIALAAIINSTKEYLDKPSTVQKGNTIYDISGGNYDDAYFIGFEHGLACANKELHTKLISLVKEADDDTS